MILSSRIICLAERERASGGLDHRSLRRTSGTSRRSPPRLVAARARRPYLHTSSWAPFGAYSAAAAALQNLAMIPRKQAITVARSLFRAPTDRAGLRPSEPGRSESEQENDLQLAAFQFRLLSGCGCDAYNKYEGPDNRTRWCVGPTS